jgi:hypothetical protein
VDDELLPRLAPLVGVVLAGEDEGVDHAAAVDPQRRLVGVLLDDREEIREQLPLQRREVLGRLGDPGNDLVLLGPDGAALDEVGQRLGVRLRPRKRRRRDAVTLPRWGQAAARVLVVRYVRPSSSRCW